MIAAAEIGDGGNEAAVSEGADLPLKSNEEARPWEVESGILRLKKEADAASDLWLKYKFVPGALDRWLEERKAKPEEELPGVGNKRKKVVKRKLPTGLVDYMAADPYVVLMDISDEKLATKTPAFRQMYAIAKILEAKTREYHQALIDQQHKFGYALDEDEVTDDELEKLGQEAKRS